MTIGLLEEPVVYVHEVTFHGRVYRRIRPEPRRLYGSSGLFSAQIWVESRRRVIVSRYTLCRVLHKRRYGCYEVFRSYNTALMYVLTT
jgi:hypothetical protein